MWDCYYFFSCIDNWGIAIFVTNKNIKRLQKSRTIYINGTIKTCHHPYAQQVQFMKCTTMTTR